MIAFEQFVSLFIKKQQKVVTTQLWDDLDRFVCGYKEKQDKALSIHKESQHTDNSDLSRKEQNKKAISNRYSLCGGVLITACQYLFIAKGKSKTC